MRKRIARHVANLYTLGDSAEEEWQWDLKQLRMTKAEQPDYSFRIRFRLPDREGLRIGSGIAPLFGPDGGLVAELRSAENGKAIAEAKTLVLRRAGLTTEQDARSAGRALLDPLARALSVHAIGADFGVRGPKGMFTEAGLKMVEAQQGRRVLNDFPGLMVFETSPPPLFVTQKPAYVRYPEEGGFQRYFRRAIEHNEAMTSRERVAFQLFSTSFFETSADTRLLTLMMAIEALVELAPRPDASVRHVEHLIALTEDSEELSASERDSILGSLSWLRTESILGKGAADSRAVLSRGHTTGKRRSSSSIGAIPYVVPLPTGRRPSPLVKKWIEWRLALSDLLATFWPAGSSRICQLSLPDPKLWPGSPCRRISIKQRTMNGMRLTNRRRRPLT